MPTPARLYLDAARLGLMSPAAQLAARDFARLAGEGLSTLYWEEFFRGRLPRAAEFPGLRSWRGLFGLQSGVRRLLAAPPHAPVVFASRTAALMQSALELLASRSHRIFTTDTLWPSYRDRLEFVCHSGQATMSTLPLREHVCRRNWTARRLVEEMVRQFVQAGCDGVCLSSVSHDGIRLPLAPFLQAVREQNPQATIVIDGAQELAHVPVGLAAAPLDIYVAGCHKWLGASQPLALGVLANAESAPGLERDLVEHLQDPLFRYVLSVHAQADAPSETVNLTPLVCAHGALADFDLERQPERFLWQRRNAIRAASLAERCGWTPARYSPDLRTGILLLNRSGSGRRGETPPDVQRQWDAAGVVLTAYAGGPLRLSLPGRALRPSEWQLLGRALGGSSAAAMAPADRVRYADPTPATHGKTAGYGELPPATAN